MEIRLNNECLTFFKEVRNLLIIDQNGPCCNLGTSKPQTSRDTPYGHTTLSITPYISSTTKKVRDADVHVRVSKIIHNIISMLQSRRARSILRTHLSIRSSVLCCARVGREEEGGVRVCLQV